MARLGAGSAAGSALPSGSATLRVRGTALVTDSARPSLGVIVSAFAISLARSRTGRWEHPRARRGRWRSEGWVLIPGGGFLAVERGAGGLELEDSAAFAFGGRQYLVTCTMPTRKED